MSHHLDVSSSKEERHFFVERFRRKVDRRTQIQLRQEGETCHLILWGRGWQQARRKHRRRRERGELLGLSVSAPQKVYSSKNDLACRLKRFPKMRGQHEKKKGDRGWTSWSSVLERGTGRLSSRVCALGMITGQALHRLLSRSAQAPLVRLSFDMPVHIKLL